MIGLAYPQPETATEVRLWEELTRVYGVTNVWPMRRNVDHDKLMLSLSKYGTLVLTLTSMRHWWLNTKVKPRLIFIGSYTHPKDDCIYVVSPSDVGVHCEMAALDRADALLMLDTPQPGPLHPILAAAITLERRAVQLIG
jgi:hypothetical protein